MKYALPFLFAFSLLVRCADAAPISTLDAFSGTVDAADELIINDYSASPVTRRIDASQLFNYPDNLRKTELDTFAELDALVADVTLTTSTDWDTAAEINAATTDDDFVTLSGTQTITGSKTFQSSGFFINNGVEDTEFQTLATTIGRTATFPDKSGTVAYLSDITSANITDATADGRALITAADANPFTDADESKLDGIEALADVTDTANVTAAGALMDSEVTNLAQVKAFDAADYEPAGVAAADITDSTATGQAAITAANAADLAAAAGLDNVDNTADADKPVSTATQAALDTEAATRLAADNRRAFAGGVALDGVSESSGMDMGLPVKVGTAGMSIGWFGVDRPLEGNYYYCTGDLSQTGSDKLSYGVSMGQISVEGTLEVRMRQNTASLATYYAVRTSNVVFDGGLHHYAVSIDNSGVDPIISIYVDGVSVPITETIAKSGTFNDSAVVDGFWSTWQNTRGASGQVNSLTIFNRALSASEVSELSEIGLGAWLATHPEDKWGGEDVKGAGDWGIVGDAWPSFTDASNDGFTGTTGASGFYRARVPLSRDVAIGETVAVTLTVDSLSGVGFGVALNNNLSIADGSNVTSITSAGTHTVYLTATTSVNRLMIRTFNNEVTATINGWAAVKAGVLAALPLDEGIGRQLRELSGRYPALLSASGAEHLIPKSEGRIERTAQDLSASGLLFSGSDMIPAGKTITDLIVDGKSVALADIFQDLDARALYVTNTAGVLTFSRTATTGAGTTFGTVTPTDDSDVNYTIIYK